MSTNPYQQGSDADQTNQQGGYYGGYQPQQGNQPGSQQYGGYQQPNTGSEDYQYGQYTYGGQQQQQQQQYNTYQPPASARARSFGSAGTAEATSTGWSARTEAVVSYLGFFVTGIVFFVIERRNRFVRFCAAQSTLLFGSAFIVYELLHLIAGFFGAIILIGPIFAFLIGIILTVLEIAVAVVWIFLMIQAYRGVRVKIPFFGDIAERLTGGAGRP
jgi:uncharacterized membrane protein